MKNETRFDMLTHIDEKYLNEAYPKKRNPATIAIPAVACACALALIAPTAITALRPEINSTEQNVVLDAGGSTENEESISAEPTERPTEPLRPPVNEKPSPVPEKNPPAEPLVLTPIVIEDAVRDTYLDGYTTILIAEEDTSYGGNACFAKPPETEEVIFTWNDVVDFYSKDVRPTYVPEGLTKPDMESGEYVFSRVTEADYRYNVGDYFRTGIRMTYADDPSRSLSPLNRGIMIGLSKSNYADVTETMRYKMTPNAEKSLSYYNGVPVFFFVNSERWSCSVMNGSEALTEINDIHLTVEYQQLLKEFTEMHPEWEHLEFNEWAWDTFLKENGIPDGDPMYNASPHGPFHYMATLVYDGIEYTLESNLDFETFAAITASLIHE